MYTLSVWVSIERACGPAARVLRTRYVWGTPLRTRVAVMPAPLTRRLPTPQHTSAPHRDTYTLWPCMRCYSVLGRYCSRRVRALRAIYREDRPTRCMVRDTFPWCRVLTASVPRVYYTRGGTLPRGNSFRPFLRLRGACSAQAYSGPKAKRPRGKLVPGPASEPQTVRRCQRNSGCIHRSRIFQQFKYQQSYR